MTVVEELRAMRRPNVERLSLSLPVDLVAWVKAVAMEADVPVSLVVEWAIRKERRRRGRRMTTPEAAAPLTAEDEAAIKDRHRPERYGAEVNCISEPGVPWPCDAARLLLSFAAVEQRILATTDGPRVRCSTCGTELLGQGWLEHHDDGSHTFTPAALTPLAPEVPPRRDGSDCPKCGEWRDSPTADCAACGFAPRPCGDPLGACVYAVPHSGPHKVAPDHPVLLAATRTPEPPDSGDGAARSRSVIRRENVQAGRPMNEGIEPPDSGDGAAPPDGCNWGVDYGAQRCPVHFPAARLRSGSPAPEGGE